MLILIYIYIYVKNKNKKKGSRAVSREIAPEVSGMVDLCLQSTARWLAARLGSTSIALH